MYLNWLLLSIVESDRFSYVREFALWLEDWWCMTGRLQVHLLHNISGCASCLYSDPVEVGAQKKWKVTRHCV